MERKKMNIEFKYNNMMERYDIEMFSQLGDLKEMKAVAYIDYEKVGDHKKLSNTITFLKPLNRTDVYKILNKCDELKHESDKNPLDEIDIEEEREVHFELNPDE